MKININGVYIKLNIGTMSIDDANLDMSAVRGASQGRVAQIAFFLSTERNTSVAKKMRDLRPA